MGDAASKYVTRKEERERKSQFDCSFCGGMGHMYSGCVTLKQMIQEHVEQLQQQHTKEYREAQSHSVREVILERYGGDKVAHSRKSARPRRTMPENWERRSVSQMAQHEHQGQSQDLTTQEMSMSHQPWGNETPEMAAGW